MTLDELEVVITANSRQLQQELDRVRRSMDTLERNTRRQTSQMERSFDRVSRAADKTGKSISNAMKALVGFVGLQQAFAAINAGVQSFAVMESSAENIRRTLGASANQFMDWANTSAAAFGLAKEDVMSYGNTLSLLVSSYERNTDNIASITQNLLESTSVVASRSGRTIEDVLMRITSGMRGETEAIEDLGIFVQVSILSQTRAYQQYANGRHWDTLDERTKQQIRTAGILEQVMMKYGDTMAGGTMYSMLMFNASLKNLKTSLGEAFAPIYNVAIPALVTLMNAISKVLGYLAMFNKMIFGVKSVSPAKTDNKGLADALAQQGAVKTNQDGINKSLGQGASKAGGIGKGLGKAAKEAKKLKGLLMGFDEINLLNMPDDSVNGGAGGAGGIGDIGGGMGGDMTLPEQVMPEGDPEPPAWLVKLVDNIKNMYAELKPYIDRVKDALLSLSSTAWDGLKWGFENILLPLGKFTISHVVPVFLNALAAALNIVNLVLVACKPFLSWLWDYFLQPMGKFVLNVAGMGLDLLADVLGKISDKVKDMTKWLEENETAANALGIIIGGLTAAIVIHNGAAILMRAAHIAASIGVGIYTAATTVATVATTVFGAVMAFINSPITLVIGAITLLVAAIYLLVKNWDWVKEKSLECWKAITDCWDNIGEWFGERWQKIKDGFFAIKDAIVNKAKDIWQNMTNVFANVGSWFSEKWQSIVTSLSNLPSQMYSKACEMWEWFKKPFVNVGKWFGDIFKDAINSAIGFVNWGVQKINQALTFTLPDWIPAVGGKGFKMNIPNIPKLAKGGIVDSAQMFIAGEAGKEVVMPLENNTGWITQLADKVSASMGGGGSQQSYNDRPVEVVLQVGTTKLGRAVISSINQVQQQEGRLLLNL